MIFNLNTADSNRGTVISTAAGAYISSSLQVSETEVLTPQAMEIQVCVLVQIYILQFKSKLI